MIYSNGIVDWPIQPAPLGFDKAALDQTETLLINGNLDMSTPLAPIRDELLRFLPNGRLIVTRHFGHGDIRTTQVAAEVGGLVTKFFDDGSVDEAAISFQKIDFNIEEK